MSLEYKRQSIINLQIEESQLHGAKVSKSIRIKETFKAEVADVLVRDFDQNTSAMYRASALSLALLPNNEIVSEIRRAFTESSQNNYGIKLK